MICKWIGQSLLLPFAGGSLEGESEERKKKKTKHNGTIWFASTSVSRAERGGGGRSSDVMIAGQECETVGPDW